MTTGNVLLDLVQAGLSPQQIQALGQERARRAALYGDGPNDVLFPELYGGSSAGLMGIGQGYGYLPYRVQQQGIQSTYNLGRGNLAEAAAGRNWQEAMDMAKLAQDPANIVQVLDLYARTGTRVPVSNPVLENIRPSLPQPQPGPYDAYIQSLLTPGLARGGRFVADEPIVGIGAYSRQPRFTLAENGPETLRQDGNQVEVRPQPGVSRQLDRTRQAQMIQDTTAGAEMYRTPPQPVGGPMSTGTGVAGPFPTWPRQPIGGPVATGPGMPVAGPVAWPGLGDISQHYGAVRGAAGYDPRYDLNGDGTINIFDLARVAQRMGQGGVVPGMAGGGDLAAQLREIAASPDRQWLQDNAATINAAVNRQFGPDNAITVYGQTYRPNPGEDAAAFRARMAPLYTQEQNDRLRQQYGQYAPVRFVPGIGAVSTQSAPASLHPLSPQELATVGQNPYGAASPSSAAGGTAAPGQTALQASAKLFAQGESGNTLADPRYIAQLAQGNVPGIGGYTNVARWYRSLDPTRKAALRALYQAAGYDPSQFDFGLADAQPGALF